MYQKINELVAIIRRKGWFEVGYQTCIQVCGRVYSFVSVLLLNLRGYDIARDASLGGCNRFFQSHNHAIRVGTQTRFGMYTRLDAGFGGKISIGDDVLIDDHVFITAQKHIHIGSHTMIAAYTFITDFNHSHKSRKKFIVDQGYETDAVTIADDVWIGSHVTILKGVSIGKGAVIGAGSVVTKNVAPFTIVAGNPARQLRKRS